MNPFKKLFGKKVTDKAFSDLDEQRKHAEHNRVNNKGTYGAREGCNRHELAIIRKAAGSVNHKGEACTPCHRKSNTLKVQRAATHLAASKKRERKLYTPKEEGVADMVVAGHNKMIGLLDKANIMKLSR